MKACLFVCVLLLTSCSRNEDDGYASDPCAYYHYSGDTYKSRNRGSLNFSDSSVHWVYFDTIQSVPFINSNNFRAFFAYSNSLSTNSETQFNWRDSLAIVPCKTYYRIYDYGFAQKQLVQYKATNLALSFTYIRQNNIDSCSSDSLHVLYGNDFFSLMVGNVEFKFPFHYKTPIATCIHHDTLLLGTTIYNDVYESFIDPLNIDTNSVSVTGVYYNTGKGLLGFYLSNKENWRRE